MSDKLKGFYPEGKFIVRRRDGTDATGGKHDGCQYFVLDMTHDPHAIPALRAYSSSARKDGYEALANDLDNLTAPASPAALRDEAELPRGYWPTLLDRGDGVKGHYCIGRLTKPRGPYWEFWNKGEWVSAGEVFVGQEAAQAMLDGIRSGTGYEDLLENNVVDEELRRWQDAIRDKMIFMGVPDSKIDGAGCDSGDPLDFTLAEVGQGVGYFLDQIEELRAATTPPSTLARKAAVDEIVKGWFWHLPERDQERARVSIEQIIERCFSAESESGQSDDS